MPDPRRWLILAVIALAQLMIVLDATIVNIALPSAQRDLHFSTVDRQWIVTAYALAFGSLLLLGPGLTTHALVHGYTTAFWWGVGIFTFGAVVAAVLFRWGPLASQGQPVPPVQAGATDAATRGSPEPGVIPG